MSAQPLLEDRSAQPYVGIAVTTSMKHEAEKIAELLGELRRWLPSRQLAPTGAPFVRYWAIEMPDRVEIEVCMPVPTPTQGEGRVMSDTLPAGRYAVLVHSGPVQELVAANAMLQQCAEQQGIRFRKHDKGRASVWDSRTETYLTDPGVEDTRSLQTEIAYLVAEERQTSATA